MKKYKVTNDIYYTYSVSGKSKTNFEVSVYFLGIKIYNQKFTPKNHTNTQTYDFALYKVEAGVDVNYKTRKANVIVTQTFFPPINPPVITKFTISLGSLPGTLAKTLICNATYIDSGILGTKLEKGDEHTYVMCLEENKYFNCSGTHNGNLFYDSKGNLVNKDKPEGTIDHRNLIKTDTYNYDDVKSLDSNYYFTNEPGSKSRESLHSGTALIVYLCEGLCHQSANRFLYFGDPLGKNFLGSTDASKPRGWGFSSALYGKWGRGEIGEKMCVNNLDDVRAAISSAKKTWKSEYPFSHIRDYWIDQYVPAKIIPPCVQTNPKDLSDAWDTLKEVLSELGLNLSRVAISSKTSKELANKANAEFEVCRQNIIQKIPQHAEAILGNDAHGGPIKMVNPHILEKVYKR